MKNDIQHRGKTDILEVRILTSYRVLDKQQYDLNNPEELYRLLGYLELKFGVKLLKEKGTWF